MAVDGRDTQARACELMSELGPAWVKLGQAASTRPDVFPQEVRVVAHLSDLATE